MSNPFLGEISLFAGNFAPRGWAFCDGQLLQIAQNSALFAILGTTYGGDGRTTFGLPDLQGRAAIHSGGNSAGPGLTPRPLGQKLGAEAVALTVPQMPPHSHTMTVTPSLQGVNGNANQQQPAADRALAIPTLMGTPGLPLSSSQATDTQVGGIAMEETTLSETGGGNSHTNMQPFLTIHYIIALVGTFPSRN